MTAPKAGELSWPGGRYALREVQLPAQVDHSNISTSHGTEHTGGALADALRVGGDPPVGLSGDDDYRGGYRWRHLPGLFGAGAVPATPTGRRAGTHQKHPSRIAEPAALSPDFSPFEKCWSKFKQLLCKAKLAFVIATMVYGLYETRIEWKP